MEWNASLKNLQISPRKTRLVVDAVRGKAVLEAISILETLPKKSSLAVKKLIQSAAANAQKNDSVLTSQLKIARIQVDAGPTLKRFRPRAFGRAYTIRKRSSYISLTLQELDLVKKRKSTEKMASTVKQVVEGEKAKPELAAKTDSPKKTARKTVPKKPRAKKVSKDNL